MSIAQEQHEEKLITQLATVKVFGEMKMQLTDAIQMLVLGETLRISQLREQAYFTFSEEKDEVARIQIFECGSVQSRLNQCRCYKLGGHIR